MNVACCTCYCNTLSVLILQNDGKLSSRNGRERCEAPGMLSIGSMLLREAGMERYRSYMMGCSNVQQQGWAVDRPWCARRIVSALHDNVCAGLLLYGYECCAAGELVSDVDGLIIYDNLFTHGLQRDEQTCDAMRNHSIYVADCFSGLSVITCSCCRCCISFAAAS